MQLQFEFSAEVWVYNAAGGWHFVSLPQELTNEIRTYGKDLERGWGRLPVTALVNTTEWKTSLWYDTRRQTYLLAFNAAVRRKEAIKSGQIVAVKIRI